MHNSSGVERKKRNFIYLFIYVCPF